MPVIPPSTAIILPTSPSKTSFTYNAMLGSTISEDLLNLCAKLFSTKFKLWSLGLEGSLYLEARAFIISIPMMLSKVDILAGVVGRITQLVVDSHVHKQYIATQLLQTLKAHPLFQHVTAVGLVSSHPVACNALAKYAGTFTHVYVHICYYN